MRKYSFNVNKKDSPNSMDILLLSLLSYVCVSGGKNVSFSEYFAYCLNGWSPWLRTGLCPRYDLRKLKHSTSFSSTPIETLYKKWSFSLRLFYSKCDQIRSYLQIWSHLLKKSLIENFIFCAVKRKRPVVKTYMMACNFSKFSFRRIYFFLEFFEKAGFLNIKIWTLWLTVIFPEPSWFVGFKSADNDR